VENIVFYLPGRQWCSLKTVRPSKHTRGSSEFGQHSKKHNPKTLKKRHPTEFAFLILILDLQRRFVRGHGTYNDCELDHD
jgi:hypothetical protein